MDPTELQVGNDGVRRASNKILKNRGLVPYRNKETKNPRVRRRKKYEDALKRRKGQVRDVRKADEIYGGEETGVKGNVIRSRKF